MNNNDYTGTKHQRDTHVEDATIYEPGDRVKVYLGGRPYPDPATVISMTGEEGLTVLVELDGTKHGPNYQVSNHNVKKA